MEAILALICCAAFFPLLCGAVLLIRRAVQAEKHSAAGRKACAAAICLCVAAAVCFVVLFGSMETFGLFLSVLFGVPLTSVLIWMRALFRYRRLAPDAPERNAYLKQIVIAGCIGGLSALVLSVLIIMFIIGIQHM